MKKMVSGVIVSGENEKSKTRYHESQKSNDEKLLRMRAELVEFLVFVR